MSQSTSVSSDRSRQASSNPAAERAFAAFRREIDAAFDANIPGGAPVALLMFPYDSNVGNHMMWVAITDYLKERGIPVAYAAHGNNFDVDTLASAVGDGGAILFLGGVTVSRLWPRHAEVKRAVAARFRRNPLISLPATILFVDDEDRIEAGQIFDAHPNVVVMARDPVSGESARKAFPSNVKVVTLPDSALRLGPQPSKVSPPHPIIWLARDDKEGAGFIPMGDVHVFDWPDPMREHMRNAYLSLRASGVFSRLRAGMLGRLGTRLWNPPISALYRRASQQMVGYGNDLLDKGRVLVTDRLHPHVLAALRGQHVVLLPDRFGKNRAVYDYSTHAFGSVKWADTPEEAHAIASTLARSQG